MTEEEGQWRRDNEPLVGKPNVVLGDAESSSIGSCLKREKGKVVLKRLGKLLELTASRENIEKAIHEAKKRRSKDNELKESMNEFLKDKEKNILEVQQIIRSGIWVIDKYRTFIRFYNGKQRIIDWNPSFRDNVIQHALYQTVGKLLVAKFIPDTYSGIKGRGMSYGMKRLKKFLLEYGFEDPLYVLKLDIHHFYPNIRTWILKSMLRKYIKDEGILKLFDCLIDSHKDGLPIGNYLSQLLANLYLNEVDRFIKEELKMYHYLRYCDDVVILSKSKEALKIVLKKLDSKLLEIGLEIKSNVQIFPIERNGIDFMGLVFKRHDILLRKFIERNFRRKARLFQTNPCLKTYQSLASYKGWVNDCSRGRILWDKVVGKPLFLCYEEVA